MSTKLNFRLELMSDYHVGAGQGMGPLIDSALLRSSDGVPVLRGTTLVGLLRDALYELLQTEPLKDHRRCSASGETEPRSGVIPSYCGQWDDTEELCPVCRLFGTPKHPKRWQFSSARPEGLEIPINTGKNVKSLGGQVVARASINPRTRRAEEHKLFSHEMGNQQFVFRFSATCDFEGDDVLQEVALLVATARFVRNMGASRRRGWGECRLHLESVEGLPDRPELPNDEESLLDCFKKHWIEREALPTLPVAVTSSTTGESRGDASTESEKESQEPLRFLMIVRTDEPLICSKRAEAGNQFETVSYIPGSTLLGAFAARVAARYDLQDSNQPIYQQFVQLFRRGSVRFPFLYPAFIIEECLYPAIPAPLDLLTCKVYSGFVVDDAYNEHNIERHGVFDGTKGYKSECPTCNTDDVPLEALGGFVPLRKRPKKLSVRQHSEMHPRVNPRTKRVGNEGLFGYTVLSSGQYFVGEMVFHDKQTYGKFVELVDLPPEDETFTLRMGRGIRKGYGQTTVMLNRLDKDRPQLWIGQSIEERVQDQDDEGIIEVVMTTLTDTIIYDTWGCSEADTITKLLLDLFDNKVDEIVVNQGFVKTRPISSFNTHLGLPRKGEIAIAAGSTFSCMLMGFELEKIQGTLKKLESQGIGERRWEGFGQIAFNHPVYDACESIDDNETMIDIEDIQLGSRMQVEEMNFAGIEQKFVDQWKNDLKGILTKKASDRSRWEAVARMLRRDQGRSMADIKTEIEKLGRADNLLKEAPKGREKENFFASKGKNLKEQVIEALDKLTSHRYMESMPDSVKTRLRQIGIAMLADRLALIAKKADEKGGSK